MLRVLQKYPHLLELAYGATRRLILRLDRWLSPISPVERLVVWSEEVTKGAVFDCRMCGQCILHSTGMTCPMTCPKNLRNGPCGGVRLDGNCEVKPKMRCVWVEAFERSQRMPVYGGELSHIQPPLNHQLQGSSAWINMLTGRDKEVPSGWVSLSDIHQM